MVLSVSFLCSSCKKVAKEITEEVAEKAIVKAFTKETSELTIEKIGKKELLSLDWSDLYQALTKENPHLAQSIDKLDGTVEKLISKSVSKDYKFFKALTSSDFIIDECELYSKEAPKLMKDANFIRMFVKNDIGRKEGRECLWNTLVPKEEKGLVRFYNKATNELAAEYKDGVVNVINKELLNEELIPNACYTVKNDLGKRCSFYIDDFGRVASVDAKNMSPDEIVSEIVNRSGNNDFGREWETAFRRIKQSSKSNDVNFKCNFKYASDENLTPNYAKIEADIKGKQQISSTFKNSAKSSEANVAEDGGNLLAKSVSRENTKKILNLPEFNKLSKEFQEKLLKELETNEDLEVKILRDHSYVDKWGKAQNGRWYADPALNPDLRKKLGETGEYDIRGWAKRDPAYRKNALMTKEKLEEIHKYMPDGVQKNPDGTVDFTNAAIRHPDGKPVIVDIGKLEATSDKDRRKAAKILFDNGFNYPEGFDAGSTTWHHIEGTSKLILVRWDVHALIDYVGGRAIR